MYSLRRRFKCHLETVQGREAREQVQEEEQVEAAAEAVEVATSPARGRVDIVSAQIINVMVNLFIKWVYHAMN